MYAMKQIKFCAEYRYMLPRPQLDLSGTPRPMHIGLSPCFWQTSLGLGNMSRYPAQILICIIYHKDVAPLSAISWLLGLWSISQYMYGMAGLVACLSVVVNICYKIHQMERYLYHEKCIQQFNNNHGMFCTEMKYIHMFLHSTFMYFWARCMFCFVLGYTHITSLIIQITSLAHQNMQFPQLPLKQPWRIKNTGTCYPGQGRFVRNLGEGR